MGMSPEFEKAFDVAISKNNLANNLLEVIREALNLGQEKAAAAIVECITRVHRTHQQAFLGALKLALIEYSKLDKGIYVDGRNSAAHDWTKQVADLKDSDLRFPYI
jgi:hypothetical protein